MAEAIASEVTGRRLRRWSDEEKRAAVELSLEPGASVKEVAACFGVSPALLYAWRRELREADTVAGADAPLFLPAVVDPAREAEAVPVPPVPRRLLSEALVAVTLEVGGASVVIARGAEPALAAAVISALQGMR